MLRPKIRLSGPTVKELHWRLKQAYRHGDMWLVRRLGQSTRLGVLLGYLAQGLVPAALMAQWSIKRGVRVPLAAGLPAAGGGQPGLSS